MKVSIEKSTGTVLLDGGSMASLVTHKQLVKISKEDRKFDISKNCLIMPTDMVSIHSVKGEKEEPLKISGIVQLSVTTPNGVNESSRFLVTEEAMSQDMIIGANLLLKYGYDFIDKTSQKSLLVENASSNKVISSITVSEVGRHRSVEVSCLKQIVFEVPIKFNNDVDEEKLLSVSEQNTIELLSIAPNESFVKKDDNDQSIQIVASNYSDSTVLAHD